MAAAAVPGEVTRSLTTYEVDAVIDGDGGVSQKFIKQIRKNETYGRNPDVIPVSLYEYKLTAKTNTTVTEIGKLRETADNYRKLTEEEINIILADAVSGQIDREFELRVKANYNIQRRRYAFPTMTRINWPPRLRVQTHRQHQLSQLLHQRRHQLSRL